MLKSLGNTADEVASAMRAKGVRGVPNTIRHLNPVVRYIQSQVATGSNVHLANGKLTVRSPDGRQQEVSIPPAVEQFLNAFNAGQYPDLLLH